MKKAPVVFSIIILSLISFGALYVFSPFFITIFLAFILVDIFKTPHLFLKKKVGIKIAPLLTTFLLFFTVLLPFMLVIFLISLEASKNYPKFLEAISNGYVLYSDEGLSKIPGMSFLLNNEYFGENIKNLISLEKILAYVKDFFSFFLKKISSSLVNVSSLVFDFIIILYIFFFIFKDGSFLKQQLSSFVPLKNDAKEELFSETSKVIHAVLLGTFLIGFMEGVYGMLLFFILGVPSPVTWGVVMVVFSVLPVLGTNGVLVPFFIYEILTGEYWTALIVLVFGIGMIAISQNLIKPKLVGNHSGLHPAIVVISSLGGLITMGMIGFLVGPLVITLFIVCWKQFKKKIITS